MENLKKIISGQIETIESLINFLDKKFEQAPPYKLGQEIGKIINDQIDKTVDRIIPK